MKKRNSKHIVYLLILLTSISHLIAAPLGTSFTYQGELKLTPNVDNNVLPANAEFDFEFQLFDSLNGGSQIGSTIQLNDIQVIQGVFTVELDFGMTPFSGEQLFIKVAVRDGVNTGAFSDLLPRQKITATPYAIHAEHVAMGTVGSLEVDPSAVQLRVVGICNAGFFINTINQDGTVVCVEDKDEQQLTLNGSSLSISSGNSVDLGTFANNDTNELNTSVALNGTTLTVTDSGGGLSTDLASLDTDEQTLSIANNQLSINGGNSVDLGTFANNDTNELNTSVALNGTTLTVTDSGGDLSTDLASLDTDDQTLSIANNQLSISGGNSVDLGTFANNNSNELQDLSINNNSLKLSQSTSSVDLSGYLDNTDAQTLSLVNNDLSISGGNAISLAGLFNDNDATNELNTGLSFSGTTLTVADAGGNKTVDLSTLSDTGAQILTKLMSVDGAGSGIDADLLDGLEASQVIAAAGGDSRTPISSIPFAITEPGSYYMIDNLTNSTANSNGITIDADNVSLDLGGYTLSSPYDRSISPLPTRTGNSGITISGDNVHVFNGHVYGWGGSGVRGFSAKNSIFEKLTVTYNAADGLMADNGSVISHVTASFNGQIGIRGDEGTVIVFSTVIGNGNNGIDVEKGSVVTNSIAADNGIDGFDIAEGSIVQMSTAYDNDREGFYVSSSIVRNNNASNNNGNGFRVSSNSWIIKNKAHENNLAGIRISSSDCLVEGNSITDNDQGGLVVTSGGNLIINNKAAGNIYYPDDGNGPYHPHFEIATGNSYGPIVDINGAGDLSAVANADHPLANFVY